MVDIVSSRVKAEILRLLFGLRQPELHLRELARQSGLSLGSIQQELRRLTRVGVVIARKDGNRVYYRANSRHPVHGDVCSLVLKTNGLAGVLHQALQDQQVRLAFVFGSIARGETRAESDVDLMVIGQVGLRRLTQLLSGVAERLGREINPHVLTSEEFQERKVRGDQFLTSILAAPKLFVKGTEDELATRWNTTTPAAPPRRTPKN
ncbi:MAG: nucleotidyltransferase domain-containing protein [Chloroflexi bacterium]|nr:nucleotidyltransferase domain-containing protein [Chloroflexota bacterium]